MILEGIGALAGIGSSIFGGASASRAMKRYKSMLESQRVENRNRFDREYNEDATQLSDARAVITRTEEAFRERNRRAAGSRAVTGGTEESVAATKAANGQALADVSASIAADSGRRKDVLRSQFEAKDDALLSQLNGLQVQKAGNVSQGAQEVLQAGSNIAGIL